MLCDLVLNVGGYIEFDDYGWRLRGSSLDPQRVPVTADLYTDAQMDDFQVKAIVELLVRSRGTYREIIKNRLFQKIAATNTSQNQIFGVLNTVAGGQPASQRTTLSVGAPHLFGDEPEMMLRIMRGGHRRYLEFGVGGSTLMATRSGLQSVVAVEFGLGTGWTRCVSTRRSMLQSGTAAPTFATPISDRWHSGATQEIWGIYKAGRPISRQLGMRGPSATRCQT